MKSQPTKRGGHCETHGLRDSPGRCGRSVAGAIALAPVAHADDDQFLADIHKAHISAQGGDDELVILGEGVRKKLGNGYDYKEIAIGLTAGGDFKGFQRGQFATAEVGVQSRVSALHLGDQRRPCWRPAAAVGDVDCGVIVPWTGGEDPQ